MSAFNTPRIPEQERCASCGAGGHAEDALDVSVPDFPCPICLESAAPVAAESVATVWSSVDALHQAVDRLLGEHDGVTVQVLRPESMVAVVLPSGYRWHVYPPYAGVIKVSAPHAALYGPDLAPVPGVPLITLIAVEDLLDLLISTQAGPVAELIDADLMARMEADLFDPDTLLGEGI
ncbi:hypothetical protein [Actinoplanes regularis]|uniref:hypothetical protein n=1 Tax=Actinoplanes regularis TaxID=52697 RepID=UPI002554CFF8|nr:hypothetical protein [Actinoplanes regularis]GLW27762.1 hypothetical protein Areg01_07020 [Actinoplanes regularis]